LAGLLLLLLGLLVLLLELLLGPLGVPGFGARPAAGEASLGPAAVLLLLLPEAPAAGLPPLDLPVLSVDASASLAGAAAAGGFVSGCWGATASPDVGFTAPGGAAALSATAVGCLEMSAAGFAAALSATAVGCLEAASFSSCAEAPIFTASATGGPSVPPAAAGAGFAAADVLGAAAGALAASLPTCCCCCCCCLLLSAFAGASTVLGASAGAEGLLGASLPAAPLTPVSFLLLLLVLLAGTGSPKALESTTADSGIKSTFTGSASVLLLLLPAPLLPPVPLLLTVLTASFASSLMAF
jgi:hypothetical protein